MSRHPSTSRQRGARTVLAAALATGVAVPAFAAAAVNVTALDGGNGWVAGRHGSGDVALHAKADPGQKNGSLRFEAVAEEDWAYAYRPQRTPLAEVTQLTYSTFRDSRSTAFDGLTASFQVQLDCNGDDDAHPGGQTALGFFPFLNPSQGRVAEDVWQPWNAATGVWFSPAFLGPAGSVSETPVPGSIGGPDNFRTLAEIRQACPDGDVVGFGVAHGANSAGLVSFADDVVFNGQAVDFAAPGSPAPPDSSTPPARFTDVPTTHKFHGDIEWLADRGITLGVGDGTRFDTGSAVQRQQMAGFLYRLSGQTYTAPAKAPFTDVPRSSTLYTAVAWLAAKGITQGVGDGSRFGAQAPVQRQQMAAFLYRFSGDTAYKPPARARFADVPTSHPFYTEISWLADRGITLGVGDGTRFDTHAPVQRQHMAAFLHRYDTSAG